MAVGFVNCHLPHFCCNELDCPPARFSSAGCLWKPLFAHDATAASAASRQGSENWSDDAVRVSLQSGATSAAAGVGGRTRGGDKRKKSPRLRLDLSRADTGPRLLDSVGAERSRQQGNEGASQMPVDTAGAEKPGQQGNEGTRQMQEVAADAERSVQHGNEGASPIDLGSRRDGLFSADRESATETGEGEGRQGVESITDAVINELRKISELGLPRDLSEGDAGHQVLLLQRAMLLLGYLPDAASLTGYFGLETKTAVEEFQKACNISTTGLWDSLSCHALLKILKANREFSRDSNGLLPALKNKAKNEVKFSQMVGEPIKRLSELMAPYGNSFQGQLCFGTLGLFAFLNIIQLGNFSISRMSQGQSVKKRILRSRWYTEGKNGVDRRKLLQAAKGPSRTAFSRSFTKNYRGRKEENRHYNGLVIHDGEVIRNGFVGEMRNNSYSNQGQEANAHQLDYNSSPAFFLSPQVDLSHKAEVPVHGGEASEASQSTVFGTKLGQFHENLIERLNSIFSNALLFSKQHSSPENVKSVPNGKDVARGFIRKEISHPRMQETAVEPRTRNGGISMMRGPHGSWKNEDEQYLKVHLEDLRQTVLAAEENRKAAMRALADEKRRSLELEVKIRRQKEAAAALEEEVRVLKESHDTLLQSLRKKYSSSVSARAAAALLYQNWETNVDGVVHTEDDKL